MVKKDVDFAWFWNRLEEYLRESNAKQSKQRNKIIQQFLDLNEHIGAEDLHNHMKESGTTAGIATIYRTLKLLKDAGLVDQKQFSDGKTLFELKHPNDHHDHLVCTRCGRVVEFENHEIEALQEEVARAYGMRLTHHSLDLFGVCESPRCNP